MKVSVSIVTYNHEKYIGRALESVLSQVTDFSFEIIIGDDCSTDSTPDILKEYQSRFPNKIKLLLHPKNLGQNGKHNAISTFKASSGEFIAQMDGDDFWTSPHKLQKQVDLLETKPYLSACFHNAEIVYEENLAPPALLNLASLAPEIYVDDLVGEDEIFIIATSSLVFRRKIFEEIIEKEWMKQSISGDLPRTFMLAKAGPIGYIDEVISVYWKNRGGSSFRDIYDSPTFLNNRIIMYKGMNAELDYRLHEQLRKNIARYYLFHARSSISGKYWPGRTYYTLRYLWGARPVSSEISKEILLELVIPRWLQEIYSKIRWGIDFLLRK